MSSGSTIAMCRSTSAGRGRGRVSAPMFRWVDQPVRRRRLNVTEHVTVAAQVMREFRLLVAPSGLAHAQPLGNVRRRGAVLRLVDGRRNNSEILTEDPAEM